MGAEAVAGDRRGFDEKAKEVAERLLQARTVTVLGHIDADGITAAAIASSALRRAGIEHKVRYAKKIDPDEIVKVDDDAAELVWLVDLGSGYLSTFKRKGLVVTDHHVINTDAPPSAKRKMTLFDYGSEDLHLNPHAFGFDGSTEISGSGTTYWVAKAMDQRNADLAPVAIVGAVGDFQDSGKCRLVGLNRAFVADGKEGDTLDSYLDLRLFGRETRPIAKLLQYASDPILPGLSNSERGCMSFLADLGVELRTKGEMALLDRPRRGGEEGGRQRPGGPALGQRPGARGASSPGGGLRAHPGGEGHRAPRRQGVRHPAQLLRPLWEGGGRPAGLHRRQERELEAGAEQPAQAPGEPGRGHRP